MKTLKIVAIAWSKLSRRTVSLSRELDAKLVFIPDKAPYLLALQKTDMFLKSQHPDVVLVQLPQGPLLWKAIQASNKIDFKVVADVHTGFIYNTTLKEVLLNRPFHKLLRRTDLVLSHNPMQKDLILERLKLEKGKVMLIYDPLIKLPQNLVQPKLNGIIPRNYIVLPASWAPDEPLDYVVNEFIKSSISEECKLVITNEFRRNMPLYRRISNILKQKNALEKILLSGYLQSLEYYWLLKNSRFLIAVTRREYTMLSAIWEAVSSEVPFVASKTKTLKTIIGEYPFFFWFREGDLKKLFDKIKHETFDADTISNVLIKLKIMSQSSIEELRKRLLNFK